MKKSIIGMVSAIAVSTMMSACSNTVSAFIEESGILDEYESSSSSELEPGSSADVPASSDSNESSSSIGTSSGIELPESSSSEDPISSSAFTPINAECSKAFVGGLLVGNGEGSLTEDKLVFSGKATTVAGVEAFCEIGVERAEYYKDKPLEALAVIQRYTTNEVVFTHADTLFLSNAEIKVVNGCEDASPFAELEITRSLDEEGGEFDLATAMDFIDAQNQRCEADIELNMSALYKRLNKAVTMECSRNFGEGLLPVSGKAYVENGALVFEGTAQTSPATASFCNAGVNIVNNHVDNPLAAFATAQKYINGLSLTQADTVFFTGAKIDVIDDCEIGKSTVKVTRKFNEDFGLKESIFYIESQKGRCSDKDIDLNLPAILTRMNELGLLTRF